MDPLQIADRENRCIGDSVVLSLHFVMQHVSEQTCKHPLYLQAYKNNIDYSTYVCDAIPNIAKKFPNSPLWIAGDINLPDVQWKTNTLSKHQYTKQINEHFLDILFMLVLSQMVPFPTRLGNTLDVFLTKRSSLVNGCEPIPWISDYDAAVYVHSDILPKRHRPIQRTIHVWRKADSRLIQEELATFADELQNDHNLDTPIETMWALFFPDANTY